MKKFDLNEIKRAIVEKFRWPQPDEWTNFHFKELSNAIEEVTGDRISEETLKRVFGKRKVKSENYQPQAFTQHALVNFAESLRKNSSKKVVSQITGSLRKSGKTGYFILIGIAVSIVLFSTLINSSEHYSFSCENPVDSSPYTAIFSYDVSNLKDSVFCSFTHENETYLPPNNTMINYYYKRPGIYNVLLYTRAAILDSARVVVWSKEWFAGSFPNYEAKLFKAFEDQTFYRKNDVFHASFEALEAKVPDWQPTHWTAYKYVYPFNESLDEITFKTRVLNNASTGSLPCYDVELELLGDSGKINLKFTQPKCFRYSRFQISEKILDGKFNDLSAFSIDMSDWLDLKIVTKNKHVDIFLGGNFTFEEDYRKPLGNLIGINYFFYGSGKIDRLNIADKKGQVFFEDEFQTESDSE